MKEQGVYLSTLTAEYPPSLALQLAQVGIGRVSKTGSFFRQALPKQKPQQSKNHASIPGSDKLPVNCTGQGFLLILVYLELSRKLFQLPWPLGFLKFGCTHFRFVCDDNDVLDRSCTFYVKPSLCACSCLCVSKPGIVTKINE